MKENLGAYFAKDTGNQLVLIDPDNKIYLDEKTNKFYNEKIRELNTLILKLVKNYTRIQIVNT